MTLESDLDPQGQYASDLMKTISHQLDHIQALRRCSDDAQQPEFFYGKPAKLPSFLAQTDSYVLENQVNFSKDSDKVMFAASYLRGDAYEWFEPVLRDFVHNPKASRKAGTHAVMNSYDTFKCRLKQTFPDNDSLAAREQLSRLRQTGSTKTYCQRFTDLFSRVENAAANESMYVYMFEAGLKPEVQEMLARERRFNTVKEVTKAAIRIDDRLRKFKLNKDREQQGEKETSTSWDQGENWGSWEIGNWGNSDISEKRNNPSNGKGSWGSPRGWQNNRKSGSRKGSSDTSASSDTVNSGFSSGFGSSDSNSRSSGSNYADGLTWSEKKPFIDHDACFLCGDKTHHMKQCPSTIKDTCFLCGEADHHAKDCSKENVCYHCGGNDHYIIDCRQKRKDDLFDRACRYNKRIERRRKAKGDTEPWYKKYDDQWWKMSGNEPWHPLETWEEMWRQVLQITSQQAENAEPGKEWDAIMLNIDMSDLWTAPEAEPAARPRIHKAAINNNNNKPAPRRMNFQTCPCDDPRCACDGFELHPQHKIRHWSLCYEDKCLTHYSSKCESGFFPVKPRSLMEPSWRPGLVVKHSWANVVAAGEVKHLGKSSESRYAKQIKFVRASGDDSDDD